MTIQSMTAYGIGESIHEGSTYLCEIRTLNSRFIEVNVRMPRLMIALEPDMIKLVKSKLGRGKVDVFFDIVHSRSAANMPVLNEEILQYHLGVAGQVTEIAKNAGTPLESLRVSDLLRMEGVLEAPGQQRSKSLDHVAAQKEPMFSALNLAIEEILKMRVREGGDLSKALSALLDELEQEHQAICRKREEVTAGLKANLEKRLTNLMTTWKGVAASGDDSTPDVSRARMMIEVGHLLDKCDIEEEITRLDTHIAEFRKLLSDKAAIGRKLDFICQEMHREVNTISNKLVHTDISQHMLHMKHVIERVRQQVQNIE